MERFQSDSSEITKIITWFEDHYIHATVPPTHAECWNFFTSISEPLFLWGTVRRLPIFQLWTQESIQTIAQDLIRFHAKNVLEVGAGDGKLSYWLSHHLSSVNIVASDSLQWAHKNREWKILQNPPNVLVLDYGDAIQVIQPDTILSSWMPLGQDWTSAFRSSVHVQQYALIGEGQDGAIGHPLAWSEDVEGWQWWENRHFSTKACSRLDFNKHPLSIPSQSKTQLHWWKKSNYDLSGHAGNVVRSSEIRRT